MNTIRGQIPDTDVHVEFDSMDLHHFVGRSIIDSPLSAEDLKDAADMLAANLDLGDDPSDGQFIAIEEHNFNDCYEDMRDHLLDRFDLDED